MNLLCVSLIFLITTIPFWISLSTLNGTGKSDIPFLVRNLEYHRSYSPDFVVIVCGWGDSNSHGTNPPVPQTGLATITAHPRIYPVFTSSDLSKTFYTIIQKLCQISKSCVKFFVRMAGFEPARLMRSLMRALRYQLRAHPDICRGRKIRTLTNGFGDRGATITPYPYY